MFSQYSQGFQQPIQNTMMPQYQGVPQMQSMAPQYQHMQQPMAPQQPQWNNAPMANQPQNITQTGIPYDSIRQDMANIIMQRGGNDILAQTLFNETSFNNFQSAAMDKLAVAVSLTVDFMARQNPQAPLQQIYQQALEEVYNISWATRIQKYPEIVNNPANAQLVNYCNQMIELGKQRRAQFQQAGMVQQQPVQPVQPYQMNNGFNNGYRQYGQYQRPAGANTPSPMYNNQQSQIPQHGNQFNNGFRQSGFKVEDDTPPRLDNIDSNALAKALSNSKFGKPIEEPTSMTSSSNGQQSIKMPNLPNGSLANTNNVVYGQQVLQPQPLELGKEEIEPRIYPASENIRSYIQEVDITSPSFWAEVQQEEMAEKQDIDSRRLGLKEDEVRYLSKSEAKALLDLGYTCEKYHPFILISADPMINALHYILTTDNKIRQVVTRLDKNGVQMERSIHDDILKPIRESDMIKRAIKEGRHRRFVTTTMGGVEYDRFKTSRIVLPEILKTTMQRIEEQSLEGKAKQDAIDEAFDKYNRTVEKELEQDYNGVAQYIANNTPEDSEDDVLPNEIDLPMEEREERMNGRLQQYPEVKHDDVTTLTSVFETTHRRNMDTLVENTPDIQDAVIHDVFEPNEIVRVFNYPQERRTVLEAMDKFVWMTNPTDEYLKESSKPTDYSKALLDIKDKIPADLFERFNLYGSSIVNKSIKYIFGSKATLDDFSLDYNDFLDWVRNNDKLKNKMMGIAFIEVLLSSNMRCLTTTPDLKANESGVDMIEQRALVAMKCFQNTTIPVVSTQLGVNREDTTITKATHPEIFDIVHRCFQEQVLSGEYSDRSKPYAPIAGSYITFSAGEKYRIWPALQLSEETEEFDIDTFALEYLGNNI